MAEREGFEPPIPLRVCRISSAVHSTTLPPLQVIEDIHKFGCDRVGRNTRLLPNCYRTPFDGRFSSACCRAASMRIAASSCIPGNTCE